MRMHKKGHLEQRLEACGGILTVADLSNKNMKEAAEEKEELNLPEIFKNNNPVHLEIGCGKGRFVVEMAKRRPDINFIAVEKISNVIIEACESAVKEGLKNVYFLNCAAEVLQKYFKEGTFDIIYLNFSNPLPKLGYVRQRLTHPRFLGIYKSLLKPNGEIWQKTDSEDFFDYSLQSFEENGFILTEVCRDLKNNPFEGNVVTEHEKKFTEQGLPIFRAVAKLK